MRVCVDIKGRGLCLPYFSRRCGCGCGFVSISKEGAYVFLTLADVVGAGVGLCQYQRKGPMSSLL